MRRIICFLWTGVVLGLYGCGGGDNTPPPTTVQAFGKAHLETPIVGANVELQDAAGKPLSGSVRTLTGASGVFSMPIDVLHSPRFRVVISGGTYAGKPFADTLLLEVEHFDTRQHLLYVNALTTLISRHQQRNPNTPLATVSSQVLNYLEIPVSARAAIAIDNPHQNYFRHQRLLDAEQASGILTLGGYLDTLQAELAAGRATHSFARESGEKAVKTKSMLRASATVGSVAQTIGQIANGLVHSLGEEAFSWVFESILTSMGLGGNAEILDQLHEITAKLDELQKEMTELAASVKETAIVTEVTNLINHIARIQTNYDHLTLRAQASQDLPVCQRDSAGKVLDASCAAQWEPLQKRTKEDIDAILNANNGVATSVKVIQMTLLPTAASSEEGLLHRWFELIKSEKPFFAPVVDPKLVKIKDYYQAAQLMGTNLLVEASMGQSTIDRLTAKFYADSLVAELAKQDKQVADSKLDNDGVVIDQGTKLVWMRTPKSNLERPFPGDIHSKYYSSQAKNYCESKATQKFAGYHNWRLPTDAEFHALVNKTGSPTKGSAKSGAGAFNWLINQGFTAATDFDPEKRDVPGLLQNNAYFSSTMSGWTGNFYEALWDDGVDFACTTIHAFKCENGGHQTAHAGAWCVAEDPTAHE